MEESKIQALHDSLSKLRRSQGLGVSSQYSWSAAPTKKDESGKVVREDGLPTNALYTNFVREGTYNPDNAANTHGDGRFIKRNFDDCLPGKRAERDSDKGSDDSRAKRKLEKKERKKAEKKAAKLEAKRQAKLEEKRRLKREARLASQKSKEEESRIDVSKKSSLSPNESEDKTDGNAASTDLNYAIKIAKKTLKRQDSGSMKMKDLAGTVSEKIGNRGNIDSVKKWIEGSNKFELDGKLVRYVGDKEGEDTNKEHNGSKAGKSYEVEKQAENSENKKTKKDKSKKKTKRKRDGTQDEVDLPSEPPSFSIISVTPSSPPPKKRRR